jgi:hypothetical protein
MEHLGSEFPNARNPMLKGTNWTDFHEANQTYRCKAAISAYFHLRFHALKEMSRIIWWLTARPMERTRRCKKGQACKMEAL